MRLGALDGERFASGVAPTPGRERIARVRGREVHHAAPLHAVLRPHRALREHVAPEVAVVARVRVDEAPDGAVLGRHLRLDAAPGVPVAREDDLALHGDPQPVELLVVLGHAVVHVDERAGDVAVGRVRVVGRELLGLLAAGGIDRQGRLLEREPETRRRDHLDAAALSASGRARRTSRCARRAPTPGTAPGSTRRCPCRTPIRRGAGARSGGASPPACCRGSGSPGTCSPTHARPSRRRRSWAGVLARGRAAVRRRAARGRRRRRRSAHGSSRGTGSG